MLFRSRLNVICFELIFVLSVYVLSGCAVTDGEVNAESTMLLTITQGTVYLTSTPLPTKIPVKPAPTLTEAPTLTPTQAAISPSLIFIPAGEFQMGAHPDVGYQLCLQSRPGCDIEDFYDESPVHTVYVDDYWIFEYEVTNEYYRECVDAGVCSEPVFIDFYNSSEYSQHPVVYVDWFSASQFCEWAGGRLPTEAEWERAARGDTGWIFPWGDEPSCDKANYSGCNFGEVTLPVGSYPDGASVFGVMDLAGNAAEWVSDWYRPNYFLNYPYDNPLGPETGTYRGVRGGSWKNPAVGIRTTNRGGNYPEIYSSGVGFRCVLDVE